MNRPTDPLERLFRCARYASEDAPAMPFGFEARVLSAWRTAPAEEVPFWMPSLLQRAFVAACVVAVVSVAISYSSFHEPASNELTLADSAINLSLFP